MVLILFCCVMRDATIFNEFNADRVKIESSLRLNGFFLSISIQVFDRSVPSNLFWWCLFFRVFFPQPAPSPPQVTRRLPRVTAMAGKIFRFSVPVDTFTDADGTARSLDLELIPADGKTLDEIIWIAFDADAQVRLHLSCPMQPLYRVKLVPIFKSHQSNSSWKLTHHHNVIITWKQCLDFSFAKECETFFHWYEKLRWWRWHVIPRFHLPNASEWRNWRTLFVLRSAIAQSFILTRFSRSFITIILSLFFMNGIENAQNSFLSVFFPIHPSCPRLVGKW